MAAANAQSSADELRVRAVTTLGRGLASTHFRGKGRIAVRAAQLVSHISREAYCSPSKGATVRVDLRDRIQSQMWADAYELETKAIFGMFISRGSTVVDVGANIGYFSVLAAALAGRAGAVHAFEADPSCFLMLRRNTDPVQQITAWELAVSDREGSATLYRSEEVAESGWGTILRPSIDRKAQIDVRTTSLDRWLLQNDLQSIDFLKVDAEGSEYRILEGATHLLATHRPVVVFEANEECLARDGRGTSDLLSLMESIGYCTWQVQSPRGVDTGVILGMPEHRSAEVERHPRRVRLKRFP